MKDWVRVFLFLGFGLLVGGETAVYYSASFVDGGGPCAVSNQAVTISDIETTIYYPTSNNCSSILNAPYPAVAFAHGFSLFEEVSGSPINPANRIYLPIVRKDG